MREPEAWTTLGQETVLKTPWVHIDREHVALPDGREVHDYFVDHRPDVVLVFPVTTSGELVLVRQYKHGAQRLLTEFPGGVFDPAAEAPEAAARRELLEETGYGHGQFQPLGAYWDDSTRQRNRMHFFLARDLEHLRPQDLDELEDIQVLVQKAEDLPDLIRSGAFGAVSSVALAWLGLEALRGENFFPPSTSTIDESC